MTAATNAADRYQYPPGDFRWRLRLLIEQIGEAFAAAQRAGMCTPSLCDPRGAWALDHIDRDPFAGAVWNCDQILKPDHLANPWPAMFLNDAEWFCQEARAAGRQSSSQPAASRDAALRGLTVAIERRHEFVAVAGRSGRKLVIAGLLIRWFRMAEELFFI
jgi:hypothetical protein